MTLLKNYEMHLSVPKVQGFCFVFEFTLSHVTINVIKTLLKCFCLSMLNPPLLPPHFIYNRLIIQIYPVMVSWLLLEFLFSPIVPPLFAMYVTEISSSPCVSILRGTLGD